eukprot:scaffold17701_cov113-Isochrysis_galbana.AAC.9
MAATPDYGCVWPIDPGTSVANPSSSIAALTVAIPASAQHCASCGQVGLVQHPLLACRQHPRGRHERTPLARDTIRPCGFDSCASRCGLPRSRIWTDPPLPPSLGVSQRLGHHRATVFRPCPGGANSVEPKHGGLSITI